MNRKIAAGLSILLLAGLPATVTAEDCCMPEYTPGKPLCDPCGGYSEYAGIQLTCGWDIFAYGEFLYWRPSPNLAQVAMRLPEAAFAPENPFEASQKTLIVKFGYKPGFRVGLGMVAHCFDDWVFNIDYIRYHNSFSQRMSANPNTPDTLTTIQQVLFGSFFNSILNRAHFNYDIVGLNMQRPNYLGQRVILSPFFGLKWLQRDNLTAQDLTDAGDGLTRAQAVLKYSTIGLAAGFDGRWLLCYGLSVIGNADVAVLYPYKRSFNQFVLPADPNPFNPDTYLSQHHRHVVIYAKGGMGVNWGSYFCCNRYHADLALTYDFTGDVVKLDGRSGMFGNGSVLLMGLSVRAQFDF